jgi:hypothetical protein
MTFSYAILKLKALIEYVMALSQHGVLDQTSDSRKDEADYVVTSEDESQKRYLNGEYKIILLLIGVLQYGKMSKRIADHAINLWYDPLSHFISLNHISH